MEVSGQYNFRYSRKLKSGKYNSEPFRNVKDGELKACAKLLHLGNLTHIWDIKIHNKKKLVSIGRQTNIVLDKKN